MTVIVTLMFVAAASFALVVTATVLVIIGVRQEEGRRTLLDSKPPTILALLARRVLGSQFDISPGHQRSGTIAGKNLDDDHSRQRTHV